MLCSGPCARLGLGALRRHLGFPLRAKPPPQYCKRGGEFYHALRGLPSLAEASPPTLQKRGRILSCSEKAPLFPLVIRSIPPQTANYLVLSALRRLRERERERERESLQAESSPPHKRGGEFCRALRRCLGFPSRAEASPPHCKRGGEFYCARKPGLIS